MLITRAALYIRSNKRRQSFNPAIQRRGYLSRKRKFTRYTADGMVDFHAYSPGEAGEGKGEGDDGGFVWEGVVGGRGDVLVVVGVDAEGVGAAEGEGEFDFEGVETPPGEGHGGGGCCGGGSEGGGDGGCGGRDAGGEAGTVVAGC